MNRGRGSTNVRRIQNVSENRSETNAIQSSLMSVSYDSGVGNELDLSENFSSRMNQSTYSPTADIMSYRLQHIHFEHPDTNSNFNPDEDKENEHPFSRSVRTNRTSISDSTYIRRGINRRITSLHGRLENDYEQESRGSSPRSTGNRDPTSLRLTGNRGSTSPRSTGNRDSTSPRLTENRGSASPLPFARTPPNRPSVATPDSALYLSPFNSSSLGCDPISVTPTHCRSRRIAKAGAEGVGRASVVDIPGVIHFEPDSTPPRTPPLLTDISGDSENRNSNEVLIKQHRNIELPVIEKGTAISTNFITPPCKPLPPPGAPRKEKVDKNSRPIICSPSFPQTPVSRGLKKSRTARRVYRRKHNLHSPTRTSVSSMVLRSALKPRRSPRIKRMGIKHLHRRDIRVRRKALL